MISSSRLSSVVGMLVFESGSVGFGKIQVLGRILGFGLILFLLLHSLSLRILRPSHLGFWLNLILSMLSFAKPGCPFSVGLVILSSLQSSSWILLDIFCLKSLTWIFFGFRGGICRRWLVLKSLLLEGWMGGLGMKLRLFRWFSGLAILLEMVDNTGVLPQGSFGCICCRRSPRQMVTLPRWVSAPLVFSLLFIGSGLLLGLGISGSGFWGGFLVQCLVFVTGFLRLRPGFPAALEIEEVLSGTGGDQLHVMVADVIKSFDTVDRSILDSAVGRLRLPGWFRKMYFSFHNQVRLWFNLAAGLGEPWCRDGGIPQGCPLESGFY